MVRLFVFNETKEKISKTFGQVLVRTFCEVLKGRVDDMLKGANAQVNLILVDDKKIRFFNGKYRKKAGPTDVISFSYTGDGVFPATAGKTLKVSTPRVCLGDIFISTDTAKKQAKEHKHSLKREVEILFIHGLLHVFGFDHKNDKEEKKMEKYAKKIL